MTLVARGNLLIYSDFYSWNNFNVNLHNLSQEYCTLHTMCTSKIWQRVAGTAVKKQNMFCLWPYPSIQ